MLHDGGKVGENRGTLVSLGGTGVREHFLEEIALELNLQNGS